MPAPRSILLVSHMTPPTTMSAARRAAGLTKYLSRLGHQVTVLTSVMSGSGPVPGAASTVRTRDLLISPLNWRRSGFAALKGEGDGAYAGTPSAVAGWVIPDLELVGWIPFALPRARALAKHGHFDCVITSSPPQSAHLIGLTLQSAGVAWVADFRDGWTFESQRPLWALEALGRLDHDLERRVATRADAVCAVTDPIAADLSTRFGRSVATITNGFDPDAMPDIDGRSEHLLSSERRTLVHTGTLSFGGRPLGPLLDALRSLRDSAPSAIRRLEVALVGPATDSERAQVDGAGLTDTVRLTGPVSHEAALALQRAADGLLVITGPGQSGVATGKLYEYLTARRPILVIGDDTAAAGIVRRTGAGIAVGRDDPSALASALQRFAESPGDLPRPTPEAVAAFAYPSLAAQMAELVEQAIARRDGTPNGGGPGGDHGPGR
jgi:glycosyltransferase involved in cell wall biosynthesis